MLLGGGMLLAAGGGDGAGCDAGIMGCTRACRLLQLLLCPNGHKLQQCLWATLHRRWQPVL